MAENKVLSEEEIVNWSREAYQKATSFLAEKGVITETVSMEKSRYLAPLLAVWKIKATDGKWFWVISGDLPSDMMAEAGAASARDAVRAFSFKWQLDCEKIRTAEQQTQASLEFAAVLQNRAEGLYDLFEQDDLWQA